MLVSSIRVLRRAPRHLPIDKAHHHALMYKGPSAKNFSYKIHLYTSPRLSFLTM